MNRTMEKPHIGTPPMIGLVAVLALAAAAGLLIGQLQMLGSARIGIIAAGVIGAIVYASMNPWRGLILLMAATQFSGIAFNSGQFTLRPDELVFVFVMGVWLLLFLQGKARLHATILDIPLIGLVITGFIASYLYSLDRSYSYRSLVLQMVFMAMYFFTVNVLLDRRDKIDRAALVLMVIAGLHALYAIVALAANRVGLDLGGISDTHLFTLAIPSTAGFFPEANILGAFAAMMLALFLTHLVTQGGTGIMKTRYLVAGVALLFIASLTSLTRSAWVGTVLILAILPFYSKPRWNVVNPRAVATIVLVVLGVGLVAFPVVNYAFSSASGHDGALADRFSNILNTDSGSVEGRLLRQEVAFDRWKEKPIIGYGVLSMRVGTLSTRGWLFSTMLQSLHDTGIIGGFFMLWVHVVPIIYGLRAAARTTSRTRRATLVGLAMGAVIMAISSQLSSFVWLGFPWVFLGILVAAAKDVMMNNRLAEPEAA